MVQTQNIKPKIIIITGPTAIGKSGLAVNIAQEVNGEIISADSMQIYRRLDIGTGKITQTETNGIKHHLIDIKNPDEEYSVNNFVLDANNCIDAIIRNNKLPIITGGTGLYINALLNGFNFASTPKSDELREKLNNDYQEKGAEYLYGQLKEIDPISAEKIFPGDSKKIIRALEIFYLTGEKKSEKATVSTNSQFDYLLFVLEQEREQLYNNINKRVDLMFEDGLVEEVKSLYSYKGCQSMQAIGYKEVLNYLDGNESLLFTQNFVKQNSRHYAKRQMTYFRWMKLDKVFIKVEEKSAIIYKTKQFIR